MTSYAYNEDLMMAGIRRYQAERQALAKPLPVRPQPKLPAPVPVAVLPTPPLPADDVEYVPASKEFVPPASANELIDAVAMRFGLTRANLLAKTNERHIVLPRQIAMYLIRQRCDLSYTVIGRIFNKHHATIMHSERMTRQLHLRQPEIAAIITELLDPHVCNRKPAQRSTTDQAQRRAA